MWTILPEDSSVFVTTSDTVIFTPGQTDTTITVQVRILYVVLTVISIAIAMVTVETAL